MSSVRNSWTRLIRFVASETTRVHFGEPIDTTLDVGLAAAHRQFFQAKELQGSPLDDPMPSLSDRVLTVERLLSPLSPDQIKIVRCLGLNYRDHAAESKMQEPALPTLFIKPPTTISDPNSAVTIPFHTQPVEEHLPDYEAELAIVIGKPAKNVSEAEALDYVLGYTGANDISFRKHQLAVSQWCFSKGFDETNPIGPCLVSTSAIPDPQVIPLSATLNDKLMQDGNTSNQIFTVRQTIAFLSQGTTLEPGSIILTGTPAGVGFARKPPVYLKDGDKVSIYVGGGIGTLVNSIAEEKEDTEGSKTTGR